MTEKQRLAEETRRKAAQAQRYRHPLILDLRIDKINEELWDIMNDVDEAMDQLHETHNTELEEEDLEELRVMLPILRGDCEQMGEDLVEEWVPDCYDSFFAACGAEMGYDMYGYDSYEQDYFGLDMSHSALAEDEASKKLMAMTKKDIIVAARQCLKVFASYVGIRERYNSLKAAIDILTGEYDAVKSLTEHIENLYDAANEASDGFKNIYVADKQIKAFNTALMDLPQEIWVQ